MEEGAEHFAGLQGSILDTVGLQALAEDKGGGLKDGLHRFCRKWSEAVCWRGSGEYMQWWGWHNSVQNLVSLGIF
jgi:hypothetical protein